MLHLIVSAGLTAAGDAGGWLGGQGLHAVVAPEFRRFRPDAPCGSEEFTGRLRPETS